MPKVAREPIQVYLTAESLDRSHGDLARLLLARLACLELRPTVLERALHPFPLPVRAVDALHLASVSFLREHGKGVTLATCDERMVAAMFLVIGLLVRWIVPGLETLNLWLLGGFWTLLTVAFEFGFGHYVVGIHGIDSSTTTTCSLEESGCSCCSRRSLRR